jgi:hypothetical protein
LFPEQVHAKELSASEFLDAHRHRSPLLIRGLTDQWRARSRWTWEFLSGPAASAAAAVNAGTGASIAASGQASARPSLASFVQHSVVDTEDSAERQRDSGVAASDEADDPLYIFDGEFFSVGGRESLRHDFDLPLE